jgi:hypothetical protein
VGVGVSVLLATGTYQVQLRPTTRDAHGQPVPGDPVTVATVAGRVRTNGEGVDLALDPGAWPLVDVATIGATAEVRVVGPDVDGYGRTWVIRTSQLNAGNNLALAGLSYVAAFGVRAEL